MSVSAVFSVSTFDADRVPGAARARRVVLLLFAITLMSLADLDLTLTYVTSVGMYESNPIARTLMNHGTPAALALWKLSCVSLACVTFFCLRRRRIAELGAWVCAVGLLWLAVRWQDYNAHAAAFGADLAAVDETAWVRMQP